MIFVHIQIYISDSKCIVCSNITMMGSTKFHALFSRWPQPWPGVGHLKVLMLHRSSSRDLAGAQWETLILCKRLPRGGAAASGSQKQYVTTPAMIVAESKWNSLRLCWLEFQFIVLHRKFAPGDITELPRVHPGFPEVSLDSSLGPLSSASVLAPGTRAQRSLRRQSSSVHEPKGILRSLVGHSWSF